MWRSNQLSYRTGRNNQTLRPSNWSARLHLSRIFHNSLREVRRYNHYSLYLISCFVDYFTSLPNNQSTKIGSSHSRKEVFQPHLPVRLPCYDLAPITSFTLGRPLRSRLSGTPGFHGLTGGVYKARERIHRAMADARLLANPASWSRVADSNPN